MLPLEKKREFIEHRSEGLSLRKIESLIGIAHQTACNWDKELANEISTLKQDKLTELYNTYTMTKEARIKTLGKSLDSINKALEETDLTMVAPEKLLDLKLKYLEALQAEYIPARESLSGGSETPTPQKLIIALAEIVDKVRAGELNDKQADKEVKAIYNLLKGYEIVELKEKLDTLNAIIGSR
jgi:hypothetical protein